MEQQPKALGGEIVVRDDAFVAARAVLAEPERGPTGSRRLEAIRAAQRRLQARGVVRHAQSVARLIVLQIEIEDWRRARHDAHL